MAHLRIALVSFGLLLLTISCGVQTDGKDEKHLVRQSELAALMRIMETHGDEVKIALEQGAELPGRPEGIENLLLAEPTPKMNIHAGTYPVFVKQYLDKVDAIYAASEKDQKTVFNDMIQSCSSCHKMNCPGPLVKIDKMFIKE